MGHTSTDTGSYALHLLHLMSQNASEAYVAAVCRRSFLSLWSYSNPRGKKGKELCDLLVVCGSDVAIVSVKDIRPSELADEGVRVERWMKRALDGSFKQIAGAERWLSQQRAVTDMTGERAVELPPLAERRVYRLALAFGGRGEMPLYSGDVGGGFVHAMDERAFDLVLSELDTAVDFFAYLRAKEDFLGRVLAVMEGQEEDLLALYLLGNRRFNVPDSTTLLVVGEDLWSGFAESEAYKARQAADRVSRFWDALVETHVRGLREGTAYGLEELSPTPTLYGAEPALRVLAMESRFARRVLSEQVLDLIGPSRRTIRARMVPSPEQAVTYVFLAARDGEEERDQMIELVARSWVARDHYRENPTVIGLVLGDLRPGEPVHLSMLHLPTWTDEHAAQAAVARDELGFFARPVWRRVDRDEYPSP